MSSDNMAGDVILIQLVLCLSHGQSAKETGEKPQTALLFHIKMIQLVLVSRVVYIRTLKGPLDETPIAIVSMSREEKSPSFFSSNETLNALLSTLCLIVYAMEPVTRDRLCTVEI